MQVSLIVYADVKRRRARRRIESLANTVTFTCRNDAQAAIVCHGGTTPPPSSSLCILVRLQAHRNQPTERRSELVVTATLRKIDPFGTSASVANLSSDRYCLVSIRHLRPLRDRHCSTRRIKSQLPSTDSQTRVLMANTMSEGGEPDVETRGHEKADHVYREGAIAGEGGETKRGLKSRHIQFL